MQDRAGVVSWSGGKDCCLALYLAVKAGLRVWTLLNMRVEGGGRSRSHGLRDSVVEAQARALGLNLLAVDTSWSAYERNFVQSLQRLRRRGVEIAVFGDIDLPPHLEWEQGVCRAADLIPALPLWQRGRAQVLRELLEAGFESRIVALRAECLPPSYLGRSLSLDLAAELERLGVDACGENGEFHTIVTNGPLFRRPLELRAGEAELRDGYWFLDLDIDTTASILRRARFA